MCTIPTSVSMCLYFQKYTLLWISTQQHDSNLWILITAFPFEINLFYIFNSNRRLQKVPVCCLLGLNHLRQKRLQNSFDCIITCSLMKLVLRLFSPRLIKFVHSVEDRWIGLIVKKCPGDIMHEPSFRPYRKYFNGCQCCLVYLDISYANWGYLIHSRTFIPIQRLYVICRDIAQCNISIAGRQKYWYLSPQQLKLIFDDFFNFSLLLLLLLPYDLLVLVALHHRGQLGHVLLPLVLPGHLLVREEYGRVPACNSLMTLWWTSGHNFWNWWIWRDACSLTVWSVASPPAQHRNVRNAVFWAKIELIWWWPLTVQWVLCTFFRQEKHWMSDLVFPTNWKFYGCKTGSKQTR